MLRLISLGGQFRGTIGFRLRFFKEWGIRGFQRKYHDELTAMIKAQQQFNGSARLMQTNSEMVEKLTR